MDDLRWVLLAAGVAVVLALYAWERSRRRREREDEVFIDDDDRDILAGISASHGLDDPFFDLKDLRGERPPLDAEDMEGLRGLKPDEERPAPASASPPPSSPRPPPPEPVVPLAAAGPARPESRPGASATEARPSPSASPSPPEARAAAAAPAEARLRPSAPEPRRARPGGDELLIVLNVMAEPDHPFTGVALRDALESVEMRFGDMAIFHHHGVGDMRTDVPVFSAANMLKPGHFDLEELEALTTPGVSLFMRLPGPLDPRVAFELMLNTGQRLAQDLGGELRDDTRSVLSTQSIAHIRERIAEFNRRQLLAS